MMLMAGLGALLVVVYRRGYSGYPAAPVGLAKLHRGEAAFVEAVAEYTLLYNGFWSPSRRGATLAV